MIFAFIIVNKKSVIHYSFQTESNNLENRAHPILEKDKCLCLWLNFIVLHIDYRRGIFLDY